MLTNGYETVFRDKNYQTNRNWRGDLILHWHSLLKYFIDLDLAH